MSAETVYYIAYLVSLAMNGALALFCVYLWLEYCDGKARTSSIEDHLFREQNRTKRLQEKIDNARKVLE